jgi:hypothetical protein
MLAGVRDVEVAIDSTNTSWIGKPPAIVSGRQDRKAIPPMLVVPVGNSEAQIWMCSRLGFGTTLIIPRSKRLGA